MSDIDSRALFAADRSKILVMAAVGFLVSSVQAIAIPLLPRFPELLDADPVDTGWVLTATLLAGVISVPICGRLADLYGKRRVLVIQLSLILVGTLLVCFEQGLAWVIVGRAAQGFALGLVPVGLGLLRDAVHGANLTRGIVIVTGALGLGGAVNHPVAALIAEYSDWHLIFGGYALVLAGVIVGVLVVLPAGPRGVHGRFDVLGAVLLAGGLSALIVVLSRFPLWGVSALTIGLLALGGVVLAAFVVVELRVAAPIVNLRVLRQRTVLLTNGIAVGVGFGSFVTFGSLPQLMQAPLGSEVGLGMSILESALCLAFMGAVMFLATPLARRVIERFGAEATLALGCVAFLAGAVFAVFFLDNVGQVLAIAALVGAATAFASSAMPAIIMRAVPLGETASANGLMTVLQTFGSSVSAALAGAVIGASSIVVDGVVSPTRAAYTTLFTIGVVIAVIALGGALLLRRQRAEATPPPS